MVQSYYSKDVPLTLINTLKYVIMVLYTLFSVCDLKKIATLQHLGKLLSSLTTSSALVYQTSISLNLAL